MDNLNYMPRASVGIVVFKDEEVLLVKNLASSSHAKEIYGLPAGKVEPGETEVHAAMRELKEETGLVSTEEDLHEFPNNYYIASIALKDGVSEWGFRVFLCKRYSGEIQSSMDTAPEWVAIHDLDNYTLLPNVKVAILEGLKNL